MMAMQPALDYSATRVALTPINLRETYILLMQSSPVLAKRLQNEIQVQRRRQGAVAEDYLGLNLNIETIGQIIVELTKLGEQVLHSTNPRALERALLKELIECWLSLAEWMLTDVEITDTVVH
ncbi:hypothetical protein [Halioxenophilus aromaticivorans]|uniref:Uncharacterized protein n=1 Tax=Halioxenophilus aromaticivorans TaxID=1306992 RepID=A0AAV3U696_9ALTE